MTKLLLHYLNYFLAWSSKACVHSWCKVSCRAEIWLVCSIMMKTTVPIPRLWQAEQWNPVYMKTAQTFARLEEQTQLFFLCLFSFSPTTMWKSWLNNGVLWSSYNHPSWQMMPIWLFSLGIVLDYLIFWGKILNCLLIQSHPLSQKWVFCHQVPALKGSALPGQAGWEKSSRKDEIFLLTIIFISWQ